MSSEFSTTSFSLGAGTWSLPMNDITRMCFFSSTTSGQGISAFFILNKQTNKQTNNQTHACMSFAIKFLFYRIFKKLYTPTTFLQQWKKTPTAYTLMSRTSPDSTNNCSDFKSFFMRRNWTNYVTQLWQILNNESRLVKSASLSAYRVERWQTPGLNGSPSDQHLWTPQSNRLENDTRASRCETSRSSRGRGVCVHLARLCISFSAHSLMTFRGFSLLKRSLKR